MSGQAGEERITSRTTPSGIDVRRRSGSAVGAFGLDARGVRGDRLVDPGSHPPHLRQKHRDVDTGLLQTDELTGHPRPVRVSHHHGQDVVAEMAAQPAGRPAGRHLRGVLAEFLLPAGQAFWATQRTASETASTKRQAIATVCAASPRSSEHGSGSGGYPDVTSNTSLSRGDRGGRV
ncbi:hypothetical protein [Streptomyces erythrochromogenes]|uniref:hypothetical protein n=1 Tax=Streptomyces erythrochromogenes TaxID=285574 RepID=UPI0036881C06